MSNAAIIIDAEPEPQPRKPQDDTTMLAIISRASTDPNVDIDKMERLLAMKERMDAKAAEQAFNDAMNMAQSEVRAIGWDKQNGQTHSSYVTYAKMDSAIRPIYIKYGFALSFDTGEPVNPQEVRFMCYVSHKDGHTRTYKVDMPADGKGAKGNDVMTRTHAFGSATSYGRRYLLKMIFNVVEAAEDDDGVSASRVEKAKSQAQLAWEETWNALSEDQRGMLTEFSQQIVQILGSGDAELARDTIATKGLDGDEMYALYGLFNKEARKVLGRAVFTKRKQA